MIKLQQILPKVGKKKKEKRNSESTRMIRIASGLAAE